MLQNIRTVVLLLLLYLIESLYYFMLFFVVSLKKNNINTSSINFYLFTSYLPIILHIMLFGSISAYYNKHFHRERFIKLFICYKRKKIQKILMDLDKTLLLVFFLTFIPIISAHNKPAFITLIICYAIYIY